MFGKVFSAVVTVVTICFIFAGILYFAAGFFGIKPYIVLSSSMEPVMPSGALAFIDTKDKEAEVGDIVTFEIPASREGADNSLTVTHRVDEVLDEYLLTKGDANDMPDPSPVQRDQIIGKYIFCIPKLGRLMNGRGRYFFMAGVLAVVLLNIGAALLLSGKKR